MDRKTITDNNYNYRKTIDLDSSKALFFQPYFFFISFIDFARFWMESFCKSALLILAFLEALFFTLLFFCYAKMIFAMILSLKLYQYLWYCSTWSKIRLWIVAAAWFDHWIWIWASRHWLWVGSGLLNSISIWSSTVMLYYMNLPSTLPWNIVFMSGLVLLNATWIFWITYRTRSLEQFSCWFLVFRLF